MADDGPECPYCGFVHEDPQVVDGDCYEQRCLGCGKVFSVQVQVLVDYVSSKIKE